MSADITRKDILLNPEHLQEFMDALKKQIAQHETEIKRLRETADKMEVDKNNYVSKLALLEDWKQMLDHGDFGMMRQIVVDFKEKLRELGKDKPNEEHSEEQNESLWSNSG